MNKIRTNTDSLLAERYQVTLPIYAIKILLKYLSTNANSDMYYKNQLKNINSAERTLLMAHKELVYIITSELKKHDLDWKLIFKEVVGLTKKGRSDEVPF